MPVELFDFAQLSQQRKAVPKFNNTFFSGEISQPDITSQRHTLAAALVGKTSPPWREHRALKIDRTARRVLAAKQQRVEPTYWEDVKYTRRNGMR